MLFTVRTTAMKGVNNTSGSKAVINLRSDQLYRLNINNGHLMGQI